VELVALSDIVLVGEELEVVIRTTVTEFTQQRQL